MNHTDFTEIERAIRGPAARPGIISPGLLRLIFIFLFAELIIGAVVIWLFA